MLFRNSLTAHPDYANTMHKTERDIPFMKGYTLFNVEQTDDLPTPDYALAEAPKMTSAERIAKLEAFFQLTGHQQETASS